MLGASAGSYHVHSPFPPSHLVFGFCSPQSSHRVYGTRGVSATNSDAPAHEGGGKCSKILLGKGGEQGSLENGTLEVGVTGTLWDLGGT